MDYPTREEAMRLIDESEKMNPGPWKKHSIIAAQCAYKIALSCPDMDPEKAYILGLLHDIGRRFGKGHMAHVVDGYRYMMSLSYPAAAKICATHSFCTKEISSYIGKIDVSQSDLEQISELIEQCEFDDYDLLIQLCDSLTGAEGPVNMEERMLDIKARYGTYPQEKWEKNLELRRYFEEKTGSDIYQLFASC